DGTPAAGPDRADRRRDRPWRVGPPGVRRRRTDRDRSVGHRAEHHAGPARLGTARTGTRPAAVAALRRGRVPRTTHAAHLDPWFRRAVPAGWRAGTVRCGQCDVPDRG